MELFDVYPRFKVKLERAEGVWLYDTSGKKYLDLYGGHGVISIGHGHPVFKEALKAQLDKIAYYSNSVEMPIQNELAKKLGAVSGYEDYNLFLCNSGAEANENALKLASFQTSKKKVIAFKGAFHGRTSGAVAATDNEKIRAPFNIEASRVEFITLNDEATFTTAIADNDVAAVLIEGIQGVGGLDAPSEEFLKFLRKQCTDNGIPLILDEIQSGYGRSGKFFAHQYSGIKPDIITIAKGMGNGFPVAGVLIHPEIKAWPGMLGTTFGGNPLACVAAMAVLQVLEEEDLIAHVNEMNEYIIAALEPDNAIKQIKGKGLMIGLEYNFPIKDLRSQLLYNHGIMTGSAANPNLLRLLPPLTIQKGDIDLFVKALKQVEMKSVEA